MFPSLRPLLACAALMFLAGFSGACLDQTEQPEAEGLLPATLNHAAHSFLRTQCEAFTLPAEQATDCKLAMDELSAELSFDGGIAAYPGELLQLLGDVRVSRFLKTIAFFALTVQQEGGALDLWTLAVEASGSTTEALKWMALLFQDVSPARAHLSYARAHTDSQDVLATVELLDEVCSFLLAGEYLKLYPAETKIDLQTSGLYHFYVIAYMAENLKAAGYEPTSAALAPFLLNTSYEVLARRIKTMQVEDFAHAVAGGEEEECRLKHCSQSLLASLALLPGKYASTGPRAVALDEGTLVDIYLGYSASLWALGQGDTAPTWQAFSASYYADPELFLENLAIGILNFQE